MSKLKYDLQGKQFGLWKVVSLGEKDNSGRTRWLCECQCQNKTIRLVKQNSLISGASTSCGCKSRFKHIGNTYDLSGEYGVGYTANTNEIFYFDLEDYDLIKNYTWSSHKGYIVAHPKYDTYVQLHRLVMGILDCEEYVVDHIEHKTYDNRKEKLRICKQYKNCANRTIGSNNTSGVVGVLFRKESQKWCAYITSNKQRIKLGCYDNFEDAVLARKEAEEKYFGEFSYDNSITLKDVI